jgi:DNA gyrase subunit B
MLDKLKFDISGDDFREGLTAIISVKVLNLNLKDKLKLNLEIEVVSPVSQAVSEMIENYLEENPNDARSLFKSNSCSTRHAAKKRVKWSNVKP